MTRKPDHRHLWQREAERTVSHHIHVHLLVSPGISRYLPVSRHIPPRIPRKEPASLGIAAAAAEAGAAVAEAAARENVREARERAAACEARVEDEWVSQAPRGASS